MSRKQTVVLKFGSSVLRSEEDLPSVVDEIARAAGNGAQVVAVVSAFGDTTDQLMQQAVRVCPNPEPTALASLLATGEAGSSALLGLALSRVGIHVRVLDAVQAGLRTEGEILNSDPIFVDRRRLVSELRRAVVVLPGFVGRNEQGCTTLLGRGGSDYSALFIAHQLEAKCVLLKDVDGLYTGDPVCATLRASRFARVSYDTAIRLGGPVVQQKAVRFASAHQQQFTITSIGAPTATEVGPFTDRLDTKNGTGVSPVVHAQHARVATQTDPLPVGPLRLAFEKELEECVA